MADRIRIVLLLESMATPGGAQKYGLMMLAPLLGLHDVEVLVRDCPVVDKKRLVELFGVPLDDVIFTHCSSRMEVLRRAKSADLFINASYASLVPNAARRGVYVVFFPVPIDDLPGDRPHSDVRTGVERARQWLLNELEALDPDMFLAATTAVPRYWQKFGTVRTASRLPLFVLRKVAWTGFEDLRLGSRSLASYDRVLSISDFTARWTRRFYGMETDLLYPPVDTGTFVPDAKVKKIIAVGRFDDGENSKKLHVLVDAFRRMYDGGLLRDWTFDVCGAVSGAASQAYLHALRSQAAGYPIDFFPNLPFHDLVRRYGRATLFWHAMGYEQDAERHPWRSEHFGIVTAEAMSAGCIPMVFNAGGQPEIVGADGQRGYLWSTLDELQAAVMTFTQLSPEGAAKLSTSAREGVARFGYTEFFRAASQVYSSLEIPTKGFGGAPDLKRHL